jgi:hypothetical protein
MKQDVQTDLEADRRVANTLGQLIIGGSLASVEIDEEEGGARERELMPVSTPHAEGRFSVREPASGLSSGGRI